MPYVPAEDRRSAGDDRPRGDHPTRNIERRDLDPEEMVRILRAMVGLSPDEMADGEVAATLRRPLPSVIRRVDVGGWLAWCVVGLLVLSDRAPAFSQFRGESKRIAAALAMLRNDGNLSAAARSLEISRKVLREYLRGANLYPWPV